MAYSPKQIKRILGQGKNAVIPEGALPHLAQRVTESEIRRRLYRYEDRAVKDLYALVKAAYQDIQRYSFRQTDDLNLSGALKMDAAGQRWKAAVGAYTKARIERLALDASAQARQKAMAAYFAGYYGRAWSIDVSTVPEVRVVYQQPERDAVLKAIDADWQQRTGETWETAYAMTAQTVTLKARSALNNALINGETPTAALMRLRDVLGVKDYKGAFWALQSHVRSAVMSASNQGALRLYLENARQKPMREAVAGLGMAVLYVTANDERVCPICKPFNGRVWRLDTLTGLAGAGLTLAIPPLHSNCRCTLVSVILPEFLLPPDAPPGLTWDEWLVLEGLDWLVDDVRREPAAADSSQLGDDLSYMDF